jgi:hypothetical protein
MGERRNGQISGSSPEISSTGNEKSRHSSVTKDGVKARIETRISHKRSRGAQHTTTEFGVMSMRRIQSQDRKCPILCVCVCFMHKHCHKSVKFFVIRCKIKFTNSDTSNSA